MRKTMLAITLGLVFAGIGSHQTRASAFDECVLSHMKDGISDFAAKSIKESCVRISEEDIANTEIPSLNAKAFYGSIGGYYGLFGLLLTITLNNNTPYYISSITILIVGKQDGVFSQYKTIRFIPVLENGGVFFCPFSRPDARHDYRPWKKGIWARDF